VNQLVWALLPRQPGVFNEHRWGGADLAMQSLGILHACHGILEAAWSKWMDGMRSARSQADVGVDLREPPGQLALLLDAADVPDAPGGTSHARNNDRHRSIGDAFLRNRASFMLPTLAIVGEPLSKLLRSCMYVSGLKWEAEQRCKLARATAAEVHAERQYRITVAAEQELEAKFFVQLRNACVASLWSAVHPTQRTLTMQAMAFKMLSRAGGVVTQILLQPHTLLPFALFRLLSSGQEVAADLSKVPECMQDTWSKQFLKSNVGQLTTPLTTAKLSVLASMAKLDIADVEVGSASGNGQQTWQYQCARRCV
jgi:hypothetical protein